MPRNEKQELLLLATAARIATTTADFFVPQGCGGILVVDVTARAAATTLTPKISALSTNASYTWTVDIWTAAAAINSADTTVAYLFYPGAGESSPAGYTEEKNKALPAKCRLTMTHSNTDSITYSAHFVTLP